MSMVITTDLCFILNQGSWIWSTIWLMRLLPGVSCIGFTSSSLSSSSSPLSFVDVWRCPGDQIRGPLRENHMARRLHPWVQIKAFAVLSSDSSRILENETHGCAPDGSDIYSSHSNLCRIYVAVLSVKSVNLVNHTTYSLKLMIHVSVSHLEFKQHRTTAAPVSQIPLRSSASSLACPWLIWLQKA